MPSSLKKREAYWTVDMSTGTPLYYFAPSERRDPPYTKQVHVEAILDIAADGTLAGIEIISHKAPPPPIKDE